jgi:hypothetical protein
MERLCRDVDVGCCLVLTMVPIGLIVLALIASLVAGMADMVMWESWQELARVVRQCGSSCLEMVSGPRVGTTDLDLVMLILYMVHQPRSAVKVPNADTEYCSEEATT